jgi:hypothetical protein
LIDDLPAGSPHRNVKLGLDGDNGNIPKSAALAMGRSLVHVVMSEKLSDRFISYMVEVVARDIRALHPEGDAKRMRAVLVEAVANGGGRWSSDANYPRRLGAFLHTLDPLLVGEVSDLVAAINQARARTAGA